MAIADGLERMRALLAELGDPEKDFKVIHIAGTNGKGSTAVMTASILEKAGYSVGLYTSPHLESECERVQIWDGTHRMIEQAQFDALKERVREAGARIETKSLPEGGSEEALSAAAAGGLSLSPETGGKCGRTYGKPTVFEIYTAAAYLYFAEQKPDYIVLETGLGGRLDSTNTIEKPLAAVITQVGMDHTAQLGNTIFKVAREKAGIIKSGVPVVSQTQDSMVKSVIRRTAAEKGADFIDVSGIYSTGGSGGQAAGIPDPAMMGMHQKRNAATAIEAVRAAGIAVPDDAAEAGLAAAYLPGRFEIIRQEERKKNDPVWIIDGAHNPDAIDALTKTFTEFARANRIKRTLVIFGCMKDKNSVRMVQLLTGGLRGCSYAATAVDYDRAEDPERIGGLIASRGRGCMVFDTVRESYEYARDSGFECILVCGSIYLAGEFKALL